MKIKQFTYDSMKQNRTFRNKFNKSLRHALKTIKYFEMIIHKNKQKKKC